MKPNKQEQPESTDKAIAYKPVLADAVFRPILFSTPMVQAILEGRKTQTRRLQGLKNINEYLKGDPHNHSFSELKYYDGKLEQRIRVANKSFVCYPKYQVGDILWVRETFAKVPETAYGSKFIYKASFDRTYAGGWNPSIFMPKKACRIFLKVTDVRVERLQDISEDDAENEGIEEIHPAPFLIRWKDYNNPKEVFEEPIDSFKSLWQSINGKESWKQNPWVWVYEFERIERPLGFG